MCTARHTGTSASAPIAAAIAALVLDANPNLTWRDMQHIIVQSARKRDLKAEDWKVNGVGRWYSHSFGYGIMDAGRMVELSKNWKNVKSQEEYSKIIIHRANKNAHLRTGLFAENKMMASFRPIQINFRSSGSGSINYGP